MRNVMPLVRRLSPAFLALASFAFCGCDTYHFIAGTWQEDARKPIPALKHYEAFLARRPRDPRACEVRLRAAEIDRSFGRCGDARAHLEAAVRDFPSIKECSERAKAALLACPDYFPLDRGRTWVYVDSASQGKAMRLDWEVRRSSGSAGGTILAVLFAGNKRVRESADSYAKSDWAVWRLDTVSREPFLRYPFRQGQSWEARRGRSGLDWLIVSTGTSVKTAAGEFRDCLKVRERDHRFPKTWRYDYYCPDIGRVKTTVGGPGFENPNTELLRFDKID